MDINIAGFLDKSKVNGPGTRAVLWVQGCSIHCKKCFNMELWPFKLKKLVSPEILADKILKINGIQGVTFSGGEPFSQAKALVKLAEKIQQNDLDILIFTGYTLKQIKENKDPDWRMLLSLTDILVAGPYIEEEKCEHQLISSKNQEIIYLSEKYMNLECENKPTEIEFTILNNGEVISTGLGKFNQIVD